MKLPRWPRPLAVVGRVPEEVDTDGRLREEAFDMRLNQTCAECRKPIYTRSEVRHYGNGLVRHWPHCVSRFESRLNQRRDAKTGRFILTGGR